jgi:hypothetical protein
MLIGDNPKNKPNRPAIPKLNPTDKTNSSIKSSLFLFKNKILTRQYPGSEATKTKPKPYLRKAKRESDGIK